jgi:hypothetical protein
LIFLAKSFASRRAEKSKFDLSENIRISLAKRDFLAREKMGHGFRTANKCVSENLTMKCEISKLRLWRV